MKALVVFYSRSGYTKKLALAIAKSLGAELEEVFGKKGKLGPGGFLSALSDTISKKPAEIVPAKKNVSDFDLVVLGTPVWVGALSSPMRAFLLQNKQGLNKVAFFCVSGSGTAQNAFKQMSMILGKGPIASLELGKGIVKSNGFGQKLQGFVKQIKA